MSKICCGSFKCMYNNHGQCTLENIAVGKHGKCITRRNSYGTIPYLETLNPVTFTPLDTGTKKTVTKPKKTLNEGKDNE